MKLYFDEGDNITQEDAVKHKLPILSADDAAKLEEKELAKQ